MSELSFSVVERSAELHLSAADEREISDRVSWRTPATFPCPGRTAWYVLQNPIRSTEGGQMLVAAKIKGIGALNPSDPNRRSRVRGHHPHGLVQPTVDEYEETTRAHHFGIDDQGGFTVARSAPAPFAAITVGRARQEFDNARTLREAGVNAIRPFAVYEYSGTRTFNGDSIGAVVSLTPDVSPYPLEFLLLDEDGVTEDEMTTFAAIRGWLEIGEKRPEGEVLRAVSFLSFRIGRILRRFAQAGLYRYSAGWDNFFLDRRSADVYLTDLDSTRPLSELPVQIQGMQVMRDLAGALYRVANKLYHPNVVHAFSRRALLTWNPLAALVSGYFDVHISRSQEIVSPLWDYFVPHWFLLRRHKHEFTSWPEKRRKSYKMDKEIFHGLAFVALAPLYQELRHELSLPDAPSSKPIRERLGVFLGDRMEIIESFLEARGLSAGGVLSVAPPEIRGN